MIYLGIEIGGTKLQAALGDGAGRLEILERVAAQPERGREGICDQIVDLVQSLLTASGRSARDLEGAAIGFGGPVHARRGTVCKSHQVAGWDDFPIVEWFRERFGITGLLGNDADLAGLAEANLGAGKGEPIVAYMNIGSGIGGALVIHGTLYQGQGLGAAEIGHLRLARGDDGTFRTLESLCSGWSLAESARRAAQRDPTSRLWSEVAGNLDRIDTPLLVESVRQGDKAAMRVWAEAIDWLGLAVANVITLLDPSCFVIGGGVSLAGEMLLAPLREAVRRQVFAPFADTYRIVPAGLGEEVVLHGALLLARQRFDRSAANPSAAM